MGFFSGFKRFIQPVRRGFQPVINAGRTAGKIAYAPQIALHQAFLKNPIQTIRTAAMILPQTRGISALAELGLQIKEQTRAVDERIAEMYSPPIYTNPMSNTLGAIDPLDFAADWRAKTEPSGRVTGSMTGYREETEEESEEDFADVESFDEEEEEA